MLCKKSENKNETEIIKTLSENQSYKNDVIPKVINDSFDLEKKAQSKHNMSTKPNMSPGNYHDAKVTKNLEKIRSKRNNHKQKDPTISEGKKNIYFR